MGDVKKKLSAERQEVQTFHFVWHELLLVLISNQFCDPKQCD